MGGGDDCFLSDIWNPLAALGMLTQDQQLPGPRPSPGPSQRPSSADVGAQVTTSSTTPQSSNQPPKDAWGVVEAEA